MATNEEILKSLKELSKDLGVLLSDVDSLMKHSDMSDHRIQAPKDNFLSSTSSRSASSGESPSDSEG